MCLRAGALLLFLSLCVNNSVIQTIVLGSYQDTEKYMTMLFFWKNVFCLSLLIGNRGSRNESR